jgi:translocation and assembly module TamA
VPARRPLLALALAAGLCGEAYAATAPEVIIDPGGVPPAALRAITSAVDVITRLAADQDGGELSRLRRRAREATVSALETQGFFSPKVTLDAGTDAGGETWTITIDPGKRTVVNSVHLAFSGGIAAPAFADRLEALRKAWPLRKGKPFINEDWSQAKTELLDGVASRDFFFARIASSQARVTAATAEADLSVGIESGPRVRLGKLQTSGLRRVPASLIEKYVRYSPGDPYRQQQLDEWQQALQSTSFFRGAFVTLDGDITQGTYLPNGDLELPVQVRVSEAPARSVTGSLGVDSDNGVRVEGLYRQNIVFGQPIWIETGAGVDKNQQRLFYDVHLPPTASGYKDSIGTLYQHSDIEGVDNRRVAVGWKRRQERKSSGSRVEYETQWALVAAYDKTRISGAPDYNVPSLVATWDWLRRDVNDKYDPREGNLVDLGLGAGLTLDRREPFYRASLRAQKWWPIGRRDVLTVRGQVGKVWSQTWRLPDDFGYRTGGARTIRGYRYMSIGLKRGDATIGAPALALASIQYTHYLNEHFGVETFVDAGDAAASFGQMKLHVGYGVGGVVRTPAGPFSVDVAYGQYDHRLRLVFSMGIAF